MPGHKANMAQQKKREKFKKSHPEGRKAYSIKKKIDRLLHQKEYNEKQIKILEEKYKKYNKGNENSLKEK